MSRDLLVRFAVCALLVLAGAWLAHRTEWVDEPVPVPPRGEAASNPLFAAGELVRQLGGRAEHRKTLAELPPPGATLVLASPHWDIFPGRDAGLRRWVEAGGQLVVSARLAGAEPLSQWLPVAVSEAPLQSPKTARRGRHDLLCRGVATDADAQARMRLCATGTIHMLQPRSGAASWSLQGPDGTELLRVPLGRGSVTVHGPPALLQNTELLEGDHPAIVAAMLQLERGAQVWLVDAETRPPLLAWLWRQGWVAVLLALATALAWAWRAGVRFGPRSAPPAPHRRSMKEQVTGTGDFLRQHAGEALHAAQRRALHEAALARVAGHTTLRDPAAVRAIAGATALDESALQRAAQPLPHGAKALPADLELLEAARRRLLRGSPLRPT